MSILRVNFAVSGLLGTPQASRLELAADLLAAGFREHGVSCRTSHNHVDVELVNVLIGAGHLSDDEVQQVFDSGCESIVCEVDGTVTEGQPGPAGLSSGRYDELCRRALGVWSTRSDTCRKWQERGVSTHLLRFGSAALLQRGPCRAPRDIDVLFVGQPSRPWAHLLRPLMERRLVVENLPDMRVPLLDDVLSRSRVCAFPCTDPTDDRLPQLGILRAVHAGAVPIIAVDPDADFVPDTCLTATRPVFGPLVEHTSRRADLDQLAAELLAAARRFTMAAAVQPLLGSLGAGQAHAA